MFFRIVGNVSRKIPALMSPFTKVAVESADLLKRVSGIDDFL